MQSVLLVSDREENTVFFTEILNAVSLKQIIVVKSVGAAQKLLSERSFDLVLVNAPLPDESGESFARYIAAKGISQVILAVDSGQFDAVSAVCGADGVLTISSPVDKATLRTALALAKSAQNRIRHMQAENTQLKQRIEDIRLINRAKYILISCLNMSEQDAHKYIERQAMDTRSTRRAVAEGILRTYEN